MEGENGVEFTKTRKVKNKGPTRGGTKGMRNVLLEEKMGEDKNTSIECWRCRAPCRSPGPSPPLQPGKVQMARQADGQVQE